MKVAVVLPHVILLILADFGLVISFKGPLYSKTYINFTYFESCVRFYYDKLCIWFSVTWVLSCASFIHIIRFKAYFTDWHNFFFALHYGFTS
jgi:hypothetical protein